MDTAGPESNLADLESAALAQQHVGSRHPAVVELQVHVAARRVVVAEHGHRAHDLEAGRAHRHQDLRLLELRRGVGAGLDHHDHDLAARIAGAGDVVFLAVDHPFVADEFSARGNVLGIGGGHAGLGHGIGRPDLAVEQRFQPLLLLLGRADALQHFHVAGVGRGAVERFGGERILSEFGGDIGVVEVGEPASDLGVRQEEVPEAGLLGLVLGLLQQFELARGPAPAILAALAELEELLDDRRNVLLDVRLHRLEQRLRLLRHGEVVEFGVEIGADGSCCLLGHGLAHGRFLGFFGSGFLAQIPAGPNPYRSWAGSSRCFFRRPACDPARRRRTTGTGHG